MKKVFILILILLNLLSSLVVSAQNNDIKIYINDESIFFDVVPEITNGRTMVPMRKIFEYLGADVEWEQHTRSIYACYKDISINLRINNDVMWVNEEYVKLDVPPIIKNDRTLVPLRAVAEAFDAKVDWDADTRTVNITTYIDMYSSDGKNKTVACSEVDEMKKKGWLTEPDSSYYYNRIISMKKEYPEGMRWTNDNYYGWNAGIYSGGYGCYGFAFILSDAAFGDLPARKVSDNITIDILRVGDILRINNDTHSVVVLETHKNHIIIAEGNYNHSIHWGRKLTKEQVESADYIITRYKK